MRISTLFGRTLREAPTEAEQPAYRLLLRAGLLRALPGASHALLPLGMRVVRRIEALVRDELERISGQECRMPLVQDAGLWEQTSRAAAYGSSLARLRDRNDRDLVLAPDSVAALASLARREITSYRQLPALLYAIGAAYHDEPRVRGLTRAREVMQAEAWAFAAADELEQIFDQVAAAGERILECCGVTTINVEAAPTEPGKRAAGAYAVRSPSGDETLAICLSCGYAALLEAAVSAVSPPYSGAAPPIEETATPDCPTIASLAAFLHIPESATAKAVFFDTPERGLIFVVIRGDRDVNEAKLREVADVSALAPAGID